MGIRRTARECALQILFQSEFKASFPDKKTILNVDITEKMNAEVKAFTNQLVDGVSLHKQEIDNKIQSFAQNWSTGRMAIIDRNILRFAIYELLHMPDVPAKVTINEAIEIAKVYGNENSGAFVNGLLDRIRLAEQQGELDRSKANVSKSSTKAKYSKKPGSRPKRSP